MKKRLHFILLTLLSAMFTTATAQEVTLDFTTNDWGFPTGDKVIEAQSFTNEDGYTITLEGTTGNGYRFYDKDAYLLLGKQGASLTFSAFDFDVEKIVVTGRTGASGKVTQNIFVGDEPVSTEKTGATGVSNFDIPEDYQAAGTIYQLKVTNANNTQITQIEIYKKGTSTPEKATPEISFEPKSVTITLGETPTKPTLAYTGDGAVTYSSSKTDVATVDAATGALTVKAAGTTTITATAAETDNYKGVSASYTLTVNEPQQVEESDATVWFDFTTNNFGLPSERTNDEGQFTYDGYTITLKGSGNEGEGYYYNTKDKYLMLGKKNASLTLPAFDFEVEKIVITGREAASGNVKQNIFVDGVAVSTETTGAKDVNGYDIPETNQAAGTIYQLQVTNAYNTQITKIEIYEKGTSTPTKPTPEISFEPKSVTITLGETPTQPTLTYTGDGVVTYSSSKTDVATVDAATGALTVLAAGTTTITASAAETDNYKGVSASYTLTVNEPQQGEESDAAVVFDFSSANNFGFPEGVDNRTNDEQQFTYDGYTVSVKGSGNDKEGYYYNTTSHYLILGKQGATFTFPAFDFDVEKIVVTGKGGASGKVTQNIFVGDEPVSTETTGAEGVNEYDILEAYQAAGKIYQLKVTSAHNTQITKIEIYKKGTSTPAKPVPTISFEPTSVTITLGETPQKPTLTYSGDGAVTYSSSKTDVATVDAATGALTVLAAGTTTITATAAETDNFKGVSASYTLTVKEPEQTIANIAALKQLANNTDATLTLNNVEVTYVNGKDVFVRDASGAAEFYDTGITFEAGQVLNGSISGLYKVYNNIPELCKNDKTSADDFTVTTGTVNPKTMGISEVAAEINICELVKLENVTVSIEATDNGTNYYAHSGEESIQLYNKFKVDMSEVDETSEYDAEGIVTVYKNNYQIYLTKITKHQSQGELGDVNLDNIVDVTDVMCMVNHILGNELTVFIEANADINDDGFIDVTDVMTLVVMILNK